MKEKELRIALVCFGGVSLAVYMHGVSTEILKLTRASSRLHALRSRAERLASVFSNGPDGDDDTEAIYYELLREIGRRIDLRIVVDIIAGASAGGINGTMLARAISHDLSSSALRDLWLDKADVTELLAPDARARRFSKFLLRPVIWLIGKLGTNELARDAEVRTKISLFVRSRWFEPPLDGLRMAELMYDGATAMGEPAHERATLLPPGQRLDLFVSLTDFYGCQQEIPIHDPAVIHDREHRHVLHFSYRQKVNGKVKSDFKLSDAPGLAFAARATSSFPGAFPPTNIGEIDRMLEGRGTTWPGREAFIARHFERYLRANQDPASVTFIDGGVLNNRPFHEAIRAVRGRPAYRQIDRRIVYVDPAPASAQSAFKRRVPGFFSTLKGALSDIPRVEPVTEELGWVAAYNERVRRVQGLIESTRPAVSRMVADIIAEDGAVFTPGQLRAWRIEANRRASGEAGFAYHGYVGLKLASVRSFVSLQLAALRGVRPDSPFARAIGAVIDAWAPMPGTDFGESMRSAAGEADASGRRPLWHRFLAAFDIDYRKRRLDFLIQAQNRIFHALDESAEPATIAEITDLKRLLYERLDVLREREQEHAELYGDGLREDVATLFREAPSPREMKAIDAWAGRFVQRNGAALEALLKRLADDLGLADETAELDRALAGAPLSRAEISRNLLTHYVGFPFWDILTFPVMSWREVGEFNEILVDRISPLDAHSFEGLAAAKELKGLDLGHFAGLLSRAFRENDYLLGRIHAFDRMIDIACDAAGVDARREEWVVDLKKRGFRTVLDKEAPHLPNSELLVATLRAWVEDMRPQAVRTARAPVGTEAAVAAGPGGSAA
jgi:patatin-related protein